MFEYFFIIGTIFLIMSGSLDEFRVNKVLSCSILSAIFILAMLPDIEIRYTVYFSVAGAFIVFLVTFMYLIMSKEHFASLIYSCILGLFTWSIITTIKSIDAWYFKSIMISIISAMLADTYFQGSVISVFSCIFYDLLSMLLTIDIELMTLFFFIGDNKTAIIISMILPIIIMALAEKKSKEIILETIHGAS